MKRSSKRGKRQKKFLADERFATKVIVAIGITTVIFIAAQYVSFLITGDRANNADYILLYRRCDRVRLTDAETAIRNHRCKGKEERKNRTGNGYRRKRGFIND